MGFFKVMRRGHRGTTAQKQRRKPGKTREKRFTKRSKKKPWKGRIMAWEYTQMNKENKVEPGDISFLGKVLYRKTKP